MTLPCPWLCLAAVLHAGLLLPRAARDVAAIRAWPRVVRALGVAHVATRAVILIEADNPVIGLTAFVPVGMSEVSSCMIDPKIQPGYHIAKGEEIGYFQFGGSTHCLVFRPGAIAGFSLTAIPQPHDPHPSLVRVRSQLATATSG